MGQSSMPTEPPVRTPAPAPPGAAAPQPPARRAWRLHRHAPAIFLILALYAVAAFFRWTGQLPYGSDSDEHLLVARTMLQTGQFTVGELHGTKYPPFVSELLIAFTTLHLDPRWSMIILNCALILAAALLFYILAAPRLSTIAALAGALFLVVNPTLWSSAHLIIADVIFFFLGMLVLSFTLNLRQPRSGATALASLLAVLAVLTRSVGAALAVTLFASLFLLSVRTLTWRKLASLLLILAVPALLLLAYMKLQGQYGSHPTGYAESFFLVDPFDLSQGNMNAQQFVIRTLRRAAFSVGDIGAAIGLPSVSGLTSVGLALLLLGAACCLGLREGLLMAVYILPFAGIMMLWPYQSPRFAIPLLPAAAFGIAVATQYLRGRGRELILGACTLLFLCHLVNAAWTLRIAGIHERADRSAMHAGFQDLSQWAEANLPAQDQIASFDYRELTLRLGRPVLPLWYSTDYPAHIARMREQGVTWLITSGAIVDRRGEYARALVAALGPQARLAYKNNQFEVYAIQ